jgi:hypothetical protein
VRLRLCHDRRNESFDMPLIRTGWRRVKSDVGEKKINDIGSLME